MFKNLHPQLICCPCFADAKIERVQVPIAVTDKAADESVGTQHPAGFFTAPQFVLIRMIMPFHPGGVLFQVSHVPRLQGGFDEAIFQITFDAILRHPVMDDVIAAPAQVPQHVGDAVAVFLLYFREPVDAVDQLSAVAPGCAPADTVRFHQRHRETPFSQRQRSCNPGKTGPDDADIHRDTALEHRIIRDLVDGRGEIGIGVFLSLMGCFHIFINFTETRCPASC